MSTERELLKKALDFMLDAGANLNPLFKEINDNLLAQPEQSEQEPVAWMWTRNYEGGGYTNKVFEFLNDAEEYAKDSKTLKSPDIIRPLYTSPPTREGITPREGLTEYKKGYAQSELDLKPEDFSEEVALIVLKQICDDNREDLEVIHIEADKLLCALLEEKYPNLVKKFIELPKWYA